MSVMANGSVEIPLSRGMVAFIDAVDLPLVGQFCWYAHPVGRRWYARHDQSDNGRRVRIYMHRLIVAGAQIDHRDGNGLNNRRSNLRPATTQQNLGNISQRADSRQPYKGVRERPSGRWAARIQGRTIGTFDTPVAAARAYDRSARAVFGEFARLNFPEEP